MIIYITYDRLRHFLRDSLRFIMLRTKMRIGILSCAGSKRGIILVPTCARAEQNLDKHPNIGLYSKSSYISPAIKLGNNGCLHLGLLHSFKSND